MVDSYRYAVDSNTSQTTHGPPAAGHGRRNLAPRATRGLDAVPESEESPPPPGAPPTGLSYRAAVGSGGPPLAEFTVPDTINEDSGVDTTNVPPGYSYRVAVGEPSPSNFRGGFAIPEMDESENKRNLPGYSYRVAVGDTTGAPSDVDIDGLVSYDEPPSVQHSDPKKFHPKKKALSVSFNPTGDSNINPAYSESGSRTVSISSLNSLSSRGDPVYQVTSDGRVLKQVVMTRPDGSKVIVTDQDRRCHKPLQEKHVKRLYVLSIVAIVLFFPTGIPAFMYARRTKTKFYEGLEPSTLYRTNTYAKRAERLIIASVVLAILIIVIVSIAVTMDGRGGASSGGRLGVVSTAP